MRTATGYAIVFVGTGVGGVLRHFVNRFALTSVSTFPWSTMTVNVTGSLAMGVLAGWFAFRSNVASQPLALFLTTGVLGGYTTFSAFSLDAVLLYERGDLTGAFLYSAGTVALSISALIIGLSAMRT
jgi:fluoride exporter